MHIAMALFGDLRFDYRVFREATSLQQAGHKVSIVCSTFHAGPITGWDNFDIYPIPVDRNLSLRLLYPTFWRQARQHLSSINVDAYHAHDLDTLLPAARAARQRDVPLIYDSHELWTEQSSLEKRPFIRFFWQEMEKRLITRVHRTISVSPSIAQILQKRYCLDHEVVLLRNLPLYQTPEDNDQIRTQLGLAKDQSIVLYQGGFLTGNGLTEQIQAIAGVDEAVLVLLGDGPTEDILKDQVRKSGLERKVYFIPRVPFAQLHRYSCSATIGLCLIKGSGLSFYYSLPNKLFEYMMAGLPVLASDFPDMRTVITQTNAGALANPQDITAIRNQLNTMLADSQGLQRTRKAALKAAQRYSWEQEAPNLTQLYTSL